MVIFLGVIPHVADYSKVWDAIRSMPALTIVLLLIGAAVQMTLSACAMALPLLTLSLGKAFVAQQASTAVSNAIPGPSGTAARVLILRGWGINAERFSQGAVVVSILSNLTMLLLPGVAFLALAIGWWGRFEGARVLAFGLGAFALSALGASYNDAVVAGVLIYRALTYLLPIVVGAVCYLLWRLARRRERAAAAAPAPAT